MGPSDEACGRCGSILLQRSVRNVPMLACPTCASVRLDAADLDKLLLGAGQPGQPGSFFDGEEPLRAVSPSLPSLEPFVAPRPPRRARSVAPLLAAVAGMGILIAFGAIGVLGVWWASRPPPVPLTSVQPRVVDEPVLPLVKAGQIAVPEPEPEPVSEAAPSAGIGSLVSRGWRTMETSPTRAAALFQEALAIQPGHADANYGYGYALLAGGRPIDARPFLCRALANGDAEIQRETRALLQRNQLACN